ncbi:MAG: cyclase family protein [Bacillota bacterium]
MFYDATRTLRPGTPVYPGDPVVSFDQVCCIDREGANVHKITMGTHTGTHIDAPLHYIKEGAAVDGVDPSALIGRARLLDLQGMPEIGREQLPARDLELRVVIKTGFKQEKGFGLYPRLTPEAARYLVESGVLLLGMDTPSPDSPGSSETHSILLQAGIVIVENMRLDHIPAGIYEMYCLPLPLAGMDGSPARVLMKRL